MTLGSIQPHRQIRLRAFLLAFALMILLFNTEKGFAETTINPGETQKENVAADVGVRYVNSRLSVQAENADIKMLLGEIGLRSGIDMTIDPTIEGKISVAFDDLPIEGALNRILEVLGDKNVAIEYEKRTGKEQEKILQVVVVRGSREVHPEATGKGDRPATPEENGSIVEYHDGRLTVVVTDMDAMELFGRIEQAAVHENRYYSIETSGPINARITMTMKNRGMGSGLDVVALSLGLGKYKSEFILWTKLTNIPGQPMGSIYRILRRTSEEEREFFEKLNRHKASGLSYFRRGDLANAEKQFADALMMDPSYAEGMLFIGRVYAQRKEYDLGIKYLLNALRIDPTLVEAEYDLSMAYRENSDLDNALKHLKIYVETGRDAKRIEEARRVIGDYESTTKKAFLVRFKEAREYQQKGNNQKAEKAYRDLISEFPDEKDPYQNLAEVYWRTGRAKDSIELLEPLVKRNPRESRYLNALAMTYLSMNDLEKAKEYLNKVIELDENRELAELAKAWIRKIESLQPGPE